MICSRLLIAGGFANVGVAPLGLVSVPVCGVETRCVKRENFPL